MRRTRTGLIKGNMPMVELWTTMGLVCVDHAQTARATGPKKR